MLFPIIFRKYALPLLLLLLLLVVPLSSSATVRSRHKSRQKLSATRMASEADPCTSTPRPDSCPINCFRADPVCGDNGVTYWCGCPEARCAGAKVVKSGFCEVGNNGGNGSFSGQALLLVHIVWLIVLGFSVLCGLI